MADTGIRFEVQIAVRTPEQQGEECRRAYELGSAMRRESQSVEGDDTQTSHGVYARAAGAVTGRGAQPTPPPITVPCEGSNMVARNPRNGRGTCSMCGERVTLDDAEVGTLPHDRVDIVAMIERGDFG